MEADSSSPPPAADALTRALGKLKRGQRLFYLGVFAQRTLRSETASAVLVQKSLRILLHVMVDLQGPSSEDDHNPSPSLAQLGRLNQDRQWFRYPIEEQVDLIQRLAQGFDRVDFEPSSSDRRQYQRVLRRLPSAYHEGVAHLKDQQRRLPEVRKRRRRRLIVALVVAGTLGAALAAHDYVTKRHCLTGQYFAGRDHDKPAFERRDCVIDFDWGFGPPGRGLSTNDFSVRWEGVLDIDTAGLHTFELYSDDGARLWINGTQVIDHWLDHGFSPKRGTLRLPEGEVPFRVEFYERHGLAAIRFSWRKAGGELQVVPSSMMHSP